VWRSHARGFGGAAVIRAFGKTEGHPRPCGDDVSEKRNRNGTGGKNRTRRYRYANKTFTEKQENATMPPYRLFHTSTVHLSKKKKK